MGFRFDKLSILVVEDTAPMRKLICSVLQTLGVGEVYAAHDGETGFQLFQKHNPDILIVDWQMKPMDGIALAREIRTNQLSPNRFVPMILVTGYSAMSRVEQARDVGVTEFLVKPFSANDIAKRLAHVINRPRDFVETQEYFGPDRRRREVSDHPQKGRRRDDGESSSDTLKI